MAENKTKHGQLYNPGRTVSDATGFSDDVDSSGWEPGERPVLDPQMIAALKQTQYLPNMYTINTPQVIAPAPMTITKMPEPKESGRQKLFKNHKAICAKALKVMEGKNNDYANDGDPFLNFREFGKFGIAVRMGDKWRRFKHFAERGQEGMQVDESMEDTLLDLINYAILYMSYE